MWLAVFFIFHGSVSFGMCSSASLIADCFAKSDRVSTYPFRRQKVESNSLRSGFHFKNEIFLPAYKQRACFAVRSYESNCRRAQRSLCTYKAFIRNIRQTEWLPFFKKQRSNMYVHLYRHVSGPL